LATVSYKVVISGRVQGVSFRASMRDAALQLGVRGWVRNRNDSAVEVLVQGEEAQVEKLLAWARVGPPGAEVTSVVRHKLESCPPHRGFHIFVTDPGRRSPPNR
jgi:acylphosphatase